MTEPEYGQVAKIKSKSGSEWTAVCVLNHAGQKVWACGIHLPLEGMEWLPITTPEERRLRAGVERLEDILHEYFLDRAGYMHHATKRLADECNRINQKRESGGVD